MDRDASFLRCSKLNCYSEFNRMVQALSVHSRSSASHTKLMPPSKGTGAEYNFYQTLSIMLHQVLSNPDSNGQRSELRMIYQWFTLNKPLTPQRVKPSTLKPRLVYSTGNRPLLLLNRPQTAPAALCGNYSASRKTPICPPSTPAPTISFASSYMARTMRVDDPSARPATQPMPSIRPPAPTTTVRNDWLIDKGGEDSKGMKTSTPSTGPAMPKFKTMENYLLSGITSKTVLTNASSVAAQMTLEKYLTNTSTRVVPAGVIQLHDNGRAEEQEDTLTHNNNPAQSPPSNNNVKNNKPQQIRSRRISVTDERSKSMTTLETISEVDDTTTAEHDVQNYRMSTVISDNNQVITDQQNSEDKVPTRNNDTNVVGNTSQEDYHKSISEPTEQESKQCVTSTDQETASSVDVQVPKITIQDKNSKVKLNRSSTSIVSRPSSVASSSRRVCQVQVVSLNFQSSNPADHRPIMHKSRKPKKLVPIVAGFNQQTYRPRTVA